VKKTLLLDRIDAYLDKAGNPVYPDTYKPKPRIKPSDLGNPSLRRIFYSYLRVAPDKKLKTKVKRIFDTGDAMHEMIRSWVKGTGTLIEYKDKDGNVPPDRWTGKPNPEFPVSVPELDIKEGKIDGIIKIDGKLWIGEFKSAKDSKFQPLDDAMDDHKIQANTYVHLFEFCLQRGDYAHIKELEGFTGVEGVVYLYIDKDNSELKEFVTLKSDSDLEEIVQKISAIKKAVADKKLPPCACEPKKWCPYYKKCCKNFNPIK
jgi:hypothetical protein